MSSRQVWYVKSNGEIRGPWPAGLISRYVLLGRVRKEDEVSHDAKHWRALAEVPELIPRLLRADPGDPHVRERLSAARRWADERLIERRLHRAEERERNDRRAAEDETVVGSRKDRAQARRALPAREKRQFIFVASLCLASVAVLLAVYRPPSQAFQPACGATPHPQVNWNNCALEGARLAQADLARASLNSANLVGASLPGSSLTKADASFANFSLADLSRADLRDAKLVGAIMRNARLNEARLQNANLSYANLTGADVTLAKFDGAKLDHAIWVDGGLCAAGSTGRCQR